MNTFNNIRVKALPDHLRQYVVDQNYEKYTAIDQAVWRYVMRQNYSYLKEVAYYPYIKGLEQAGLNLERIPDLQTINDHLGKIGWGAVTVDGFIPPSAFMEYQHYKVLVIAADIRQLNHIEYTPAPDIIHESAGHAPIIAEPDYNNYLSYFGSIGTKAMFSAKDFELYEAIRNLSILKESSGVSKMEIQRAEEDLRQISDNMGEPSEMALLSRLHWWTVEYGLIGTPEDPKIYGAGLLSSIGESSTCMKPDVEKLWYTIDAVNHAYDITKPQPKLFVTQTFQNLMNVLEEFADTMAFRRGGSEGLKKAVNCKNVATAVYSSGIQITGVFVEFRGDEEPVFLKTSGPSALSYNNKQLSGHDKAYHSHGFSSPVGKLRGNPKPLEDFSSADLKNIGLETGRTGKFEFESGIQVNGKLDSFLIRDKKLLLLSFTNCTVQSAEGEILFQPEWGTYDMAVGEKIVSVFNGAADKPAYEEVQHLSNKKTEKMIYDQNTLRLQEIYGIIRRIRETGTSPVELYPIFEELKSHYADDWLASLEIFEILKTSGYFTELSKQVERHLNLLKSNNSEYVKLINDGLYVIDHPVRQE